MEENKDKEVKAEETVNETPAETSKEETVATEETAKAEEPAKEEAPAEVVAETKEAEEEEEVVLQAAAPEANELEPIGDDFDWDSLEAGGFGDSYSDKEKDQMSDRAPSQFGHLLDRSC